MAKQTLKQGLKQTQKQRLTPLQLLIGQMIEKPVDQLQEYVSHQLIDNPALEATPDDNPTWEEPSEQAPVSEQESAVSDYNTWEDTIPVQVQGPRQDPSDSVSFYDKLKEQMGESELDERQRHIMEYLIGSLDNDGLLRKTCDTICDEMDIYHNFECTPEEVEEVLTILQDFDPPGIGAQNLQQCLMLQVKRRKE